MSGSSGGGGWEDVPERAPIKPVAKGGGDGSSGGGGGTDVCAIEETTMLNSVDAVVLASLVVGDKLLVEYQSGPPKRLIARKVGGGIAGSITSPSMLRFIECIIGGHSYEADVLVLKGGMCQIKVRPA